MMPSQRDRSQLLSQPSDTDLCRLVVCIVQKRRVFGVGLLLRIGQDAPIEQVFFVVAQNGKRRRKQRKGGSAVSLVIHLARRG